MNGATMAVKTVLGAAMLVPFAVFAASAVGGGAHQPPGGRAAGLGVHH